MDIDTIDDVIYWIDRQPDWDLVRTEQVVSRARDADLPDDAKQAIAQLRQGEWSRAELVAEVRELMIPHVRR